MAANNQTEVQPGLATIAGQASLYEWLIDLTRIKRRLRPVPPRLHADLGLAPLHERQWPR